MGYLKGDQDCRGFFIVRQGPPERPKPDVDEIERCWNHFGMSDQKRALWGLISSSGNDDGVWVTYLAYGMTLPLSFVPGTFTQAWAMMQLRSLNWMDIAEALGWDHDWKLLHSRSIINDWKTLRVVSWICHCQDVSDEIPMVDWYSFEPDKACQIARNRFGGWVDDARV